MGNALRLDVRWCVALVLGVSCLAQSAPPVPTHRAPVDGGWAPRVATLEAQMLPRIPADVTACEFETHAPQGLVTWSRVDPRSTSSTTFSVDTAALPDAGLHFWRVRGVDDAGVVSAWTAFESFRVDDAPPPIPATLTVSMDGGFADLACSTVVDSQSGVGVYHFFMSELDPPDGSVLTGGDLRFRVPAPSAQLRLGPGQWLLGVHAHDAVDNAPMGAALAGPVTVAVSAAVPTPSAPTPVRVDGGAWATFPYLNTDDPRWVWSGDAGVAYVFVARPVGDVAWVHIGDGIGRPLQTMNVPDGELDVRLAVLSPTEASDWSPPTRVWVDLTDPDPPAVTARLDGGEVTLRWRNVRDQPTATGAGVRDYQVTRCCVQDASVALGAFSDGLDGAVTMTDAPGPGRWTWSVEAVDRAGNRGLPGTASLGLAPPAPVLRVVRAVTNQPVDLAWDDVSDGGYRAVYDVARLDTDGGAEDAGSGLVALGLLDPAPEGTWTWVVRAVTDGVASDWSAGVSALVDVTPPQVSSVVARRLRAREVRVEWSATDSPSGVATATLERDTAGVVTSLGAMASPVLDAPPDGLHRYRVTVLDVAGNATASAWSEPLETPGTSVVITAPPPVTVQCGREVVLQLEATGEPVTRWSLVEPARAGASIDEVTGVLRYRPTKEDVGAPQVLVRAEAASSVDERAVEVGVTCDEERYGVSCGCQGGGGGLGSLALVLALWLRRRARAR